MTARWSSSDRAAGSSAAPGDAAASRLERNTTASQDDASMALWVTWRRPLVHNSSCRAAPPALTMDCNAATRGNSVSLSPVSWMPPAAANAVAASSSRAASSARPPAPAPPLSSFGTSPQTATPRGLASACWQRRRRAMRRSGALSRPLSAHSATKVTSTWSSTASTCMSFSRGHSMPSGSDCPSSLKPCVRPVHEVAVAQARSCGTLSSRPCAQQQA
mmetsp:Transcript_41972/g.133315  ORF Transcript_41972/g.133315 Transcript_41972/m.133315 type:complete len:218 (+) Transcript_41972:733-1386(+)